jgi:hypothetical protein
MKLRVFSMMLLAGCMAIAQVPAEGTPFIEVYSGNGAFSGFLRKAVYADDTVVTQSSDAGGQNQKTTVVQGRPGLFSAVRALVAAEGPAVRVTATAAEQLCLDYGQDSVTAQPAVGAFNSVAASCPEPAMQAFYRRVLDAMAAP